MSGKTCHTYRTILFASVLLLAGCASANRPVFFKPDVPRDGRIAVLPISNISGLPAPLAEIQRSLLEKLRGKGFSIMEEERLAQFMERYRMRDTGGLNNDMARAFKEDAGVAAVLVTALELYDDKNPPKIALSARLVSTGEDPEIKWADGIGLAGDDAPGFLGLGLIEEPKTLLDMAATTFANSLANYFSGHAGSYNESTRRFEPQVNYASAATGVDLRNVIVNFALTSSGGDERTIPAKIDVLLSAASSRKVAIAYAVTGGTAIKGRDYTRGNGTLVFAPGELSRSIDIGIRNDNLYNGDRTIEVTLARPVNAVLGKRAVHVYTILENTPPPSVTFAAIQQEVRENGGKILISVQLTAASRKDVIVPFLVSGTAQEQSDYTITASPLVIKAGAKSGMITIRTADDNLTEDPETIVATLGVPVNAVLGAYPVSIITIKENGPSPAAGAVPNAAGEHEATNPAVGFVMAQSEGDEETTPAKIDVSLGAVSSKRTTVEYAVIGGTATNGKDFVLKNGTLVFEPGETVKSIDIAIIDDKRYNDTKTIEVAIVNPINAVLGGQSVHAHTILENDPPPSVAFGASGQDVRENDGAVTIKVQLSAESEKEVTLPFAISGTGIDPRNYRVVTPSPLTIRAGMTSGDIKIVLMNNNKHEDNKMMVVSMETPLNATRGDIRSHAVTVIDVDAPPRIAIMPFKNDSESKYAGEIIALHFLRELIRGKRFFVIEPGLIREKLLDFRIIMYDGISLPDADLIAGELKADLILSGNVLDYQDNAGIFSRPKVGFSLQLIDRKTREVAWSSSSRYAGDEGVYFFDLGRINTAHELAAEMARAVERMTEQK